MRSKGIILLAMLLLIGVGSAHAEDLKVLRRIYLSCHASPWLSRPAEDPDHKAWETWPGRVAQIRPRDEEIRVRFYELMREAKADEGLFIIPSYAPKDMPASELELIEQGRKLFGKRCVVTSADRVPAESLGAGYAAGLEQDRKAAEAARSKNVDEAAFDHEFETWVTAKGWITDLKQKLQANGYTYDPRTVEFICWGSDFRACAASYPIMMGRALKLANPIERRWDLIVHDESAMLAASHLVVQNVEIPGGIRLFVFKNPQGRYCADFWEGMHGPMDRARQMVLKFPVGAARLVGYDGQMIAEQDKEGKLVVPIGCGGHTPHKEKIVEAVEGLSLDDFVAGLSGGKAAEIQ